MGDNQFSGKALQLALLFLVFVIHLFSTTVRCSEEVNLTSVEVKNILEYHFHTYFDETNETEVAHAIEIRNEVIANCVAKKIIAVPWQWHYDPENPNLEHNNDTTGLNMVPTGPHPTGSFETWVPIEYFSQLYEWFLQKRSPVSVFIHPLTSHVKKDHTERIVFMGKTYTLRTKGTRDSSHPIESQYPHLKLGYAKPKNN